MSSIIVHLTESVTAFAAHAEWTGVVQRDEPAWLAARRTMLTASDMAGVLNLDDNAPTSRRTAVSVYADKILGPEVEIVGPDDPRFWGKVLEQPILTAAAQWHGWKYREGGALLKSRAHPWLGCTLDAEIDQGTGYGWEPLEGKTSQLTKAWDEETGALPTWIIVQAQTQLLVTGCEVLTVYALLQGCRPVKIQILADADFHRVIVQEGEAFMDRLARRDPPEPDWRDSTRLALNRLFPGLNGDVVDLPPEAVEKTIALLGLKKEIEMLEREQKQIRNWLRHKIGPAMYGRLEKPVQGRAFWRWAPNRAGAKALIQMAKGPANALPYGRNGAASEGDDRIVAALEASVGPRPRLSVVPPLLPDFPAELSPPALDVAHQADAKSALGLAEPPPSLAKCEPPEDTPDATAPALTLAPIPPLRIRKGKRK